MLDRATFSPLNLLVAGPTGVLRFDSMTVSGDTVCYEMDASKASGVVGEYRCFVDPTNPVLDDHGAAVGIQPVFSWHVRETVHPPDYYDQEPPTADVQPEYATNSPIALTLTPPAGRTIRPNSVSWWVSLDGLNIGQFAGSTDFLATTIGTAGDAFIEAWGFYDDGGAWHAVWPFKVVAAFTVFRRQSTTVLAPDDTIYGTLNSYYDIEVRPNANADIEAVYVTMAGTAMSVFQQGENFIARLEWVTDGVQQVYVFVNYSGSAESESQYLYLTTYKEPEGVYSSILEHEQLPLNTPVSWTVGQPDPARTLVQIDTGIYDMPGYQPRTSGTYPANIAGLTLNSGPLPYGDYVLRTEYIYTTGDPEVFERFFSVPAPTPAPLNTGLWVYQTDIYTDDTLTATMYVDHIHALARRWITINGVEHTLSSDSGTQTFVMRSFDYGFDTPGTYEFIAHAEFDDTSPITSSSGPVNVTVSLIPVAQLLDTAYADPINNSEWQDVLSAPNSTPRQQAIAQSMIDFNNEITNELTGTEWEAQAKADRNIYIQETLATPEHKRLTFDEWFQAQRNWDDPAEYAQAKTTILNAPTTSVDALLTYWNQYFAFGSMEYAIQTGIGSFINQELAKGAPADLILRAYRDYQTFILSVTYVMSFQDWVLENYKVSG